MPVPGRHQALHLATDERSPALGLLARAVDGDPSALRHLLDEVAPLMVRAARRILGRRHAEVEDVAQQALAAFVERLPTFRNESSVAHFAQRIAIYRALSARRAAAIRRRVSADAASELADQAGAPFEPPDAGVVERTRRALLVDALAALPAPQAEALALHFLFDHTVAEIAEMTSSPEETVRSRLRLGKRALRERIEREPDLACLRELWS